MFINEIMVNVFQRIVPAVNTTALNRYQCDGQFTAHQLLKNNKEVRIQIYNLTRMVKIRLSQSPFKRLFSSVGDHWDSFFIWSGIIDGLG